MGFKMEPLPSHILLPPDSELKMVEHPVPPPARCGTCFGSGKFRWYGYDGEWRMRSKDIVDWDCDCISQYILGSYFVSRGLGNRSIRLGWSDLTGVDRIAMQEIGEYLTHAHAHVQRGSGLSLLGNSGTGKSTLSNLILRFLMREGFDGYQISLPTATRVFADGWTNEETRAWFDRRVRNAEVLVIDEVGRDNTEKKVSENLLIRILRSRYESGKPTILTSNLSETEVSSHYGTAIADIIQSSSVVMEFRGASFREQRRNLDKTEIDLGLQRPIVWW